MHMNNVKAQKIFSPHANSKTHVNFIISQSGQSTFSYCSYNVQAME